MGKKSKLSFVEDFGLAGTGAVMSKTTVAPLERIKLVVQTEDELLKKGVIDRKFKGIGDVTKYILQQEGVASFWKGNFPNCLRYFPTQALNFAFKEKIKNWFNPKKTEPFSVRLGKNVGAGGLAAAISMTFVYSLDFARTRLSTDMKSSKGGGERQYTGLIDVYKKTIASDGIMGLYAGFPVSLVGIVLYRGPYFGIYDTAKTVVPKEYMNQFHYKFLIGYGATLMANVFCYPIDTIRRRLMLTVGGAKVYNGAFDCAGAIMRDGGVGAFYKGYIANALRSLGAPLVLAGFDTLKEAYTAWKFPEDSA